MDPRTHNLFFLPHIVFLLDRYDRTRLFTQQHSVSDVSRHGIIAVEKSFGRSRCFPAFAFAIVFGRVDLQWPDFAEYSIYYCACGAGEDESILCASATRLM